MGGVEQFSTCSPRPGMIDWEGIIQQRDVEAGDGCDGAAFGNDRRVEKRQVVVEGAEEGNQYVMNRVLHTQNRENAGVAVRNTSEERSVSGFTRGLGFPTHGLGPFRWVDKIGRIGVVVCGLLDPP